MRKSVSGFVIVLLVVLVDQATKYWVETQMAYQQQNELLSFFSLFRTHNEGIAFSMLRGLGPWPLIIIALAVVCFVLWLWRSTPPDRWLSHLAFGLIIGGAIGNIIDRAFNGYVVDMFLFHLENWSFAVFNVADVAISIGAGLVILDELITWRKTKAIDKNPE
ncbi:signal peptidase II [Ahrensia marina]|uniref:Lipoprotein signal peptidase n=1 Tax=Ahrensia marina TaxID=1514904 RepID=A0A0M9GNV5_9HYPH|nr:signal peptidase II [Ahrensia marina]KPB01896.1 lipoprotein signal peptidase [Ahrensia marina]